MLLRRRARSRDLARGAVILKSERPPRSKLLGALLVAGLLGGLGGAGAWYLDSRFVPLERFARLAAEKQELVQDNEQLRARIRESGEISDGLRDELQRAGLDLEIAAVTRMELERQIVALNEQLKQAQEELEFIKTAGSDKR